MSQSSPTKKTMTLKPFVKWVGGKHRFVQQLSPLLNLKNRPKGFTYHEPFVGGGALFWAIVDDIQRARLCDTNPWLINAWNHVTTSPGLVSMQYNILRHRFNGLENRKDFYIDFREGFINQVTEPHTVEHAAAFLLFIASCFNGIWRENRKGKVNSPKGSGNPREIKLHFYEKHDAAVAKLKSFRLSCESFLDSTHPIKKGDVYFIDPPYLGQYTGYGHNPFLIQSHLELKKKIEKLADHGCRVVMTGSDAPETHNLYGDPDGFLEVKRNIAASKAARKVLNEVVYIYGPE